MCVSGLSLPLCDQPTDKSLPLSSETFQTTWLAIPGCQNIGGIHDLFSIPDQEVHSIGKVNEAVLKEQMGPLEEVRQPLEFPHDGEDWGSGFEPLVVIPFLVVDVDGKTPMTI